ncbi:hypothetical protein [Nocardia cyriacigeorgica]|uniref:hypothetical protein n=1 Tax=Nocardia cyriacigeorgica TaxID=135487 RepID=UPI000CE9BEB3|nr:hypothetical protein [Nocardia cyriacigeorgica]AVH23957.1 hypothetical protein C5B73_23545 [Nocardia cyriacigeorgica]MBF6324278.1 hypothetical protein [Nocardia cyriacigeorgica]PPJ05961.1 hypothetical protein C5E43_20755 [Nocardia cyriacigeorgica]
MTDLLAHGISGATDLPIPLSYALIGAAWALTFSFAVLAFAWREPRLDPDSPGVRLPRFLRTAMDAPSTRTVLAAAGVLGAAVVVAAGFAGSRDPADNPVPGIVYIFVWVGVPVASLIFGPVWKVVSPPRAVHRLLCRITGRAPGTGLVPYPESWGYRPAAVLLFSFVWLELASPEPGSVLAVTIWFAGYLLIGTAGLILFGTAWAERADPLEVYSSLLARLSPLARGADAAPVLRWPLNNLAGTPALLGSVAVAATLLGSTAFDSFSMFPGWRDLLIEVGGDSTLVTTVLRTAGLLVFILVVWAVFELATRASGGLSRAQRARLPIRLAHSLTPIVAGYIIAHYLTFLVEKGQATLILCADPFGRGWNIAGLADLDVHYILSSHPSVLATIKVLAVLTGHILGVAAAHDRCLRLLPPRHRLTGQLALMLVMVGFTFTGLYLLFEA